jgi:hypothetical protein
MIRNLSALLFAIELAILGIPVTALALFGLYALLLSHAHPDAVPTALAFVPAFFALLGFWALSLRFLYGGGKAVRSAPRWILLAVAVGILMILSPLALTDHSPLIYPAMVGVFGIPLVLPIVHMAAAAIMDKR